MCKRARPCLAQALSGVSTAFPKDGQWEFERLCQESPQGMAGVGHCPTFHAGSCTLSVCSSWRLFSPFLKVTSAALSPSLCVRAVISSHLQHAAAYLNVNLFAPQTCKKGEKEHGTIIQSFARPSLLTSFHRQVGPSEENFAGGKKAINFSCRS